MLKNKLKTHDIRERTVIIYRPFIFLLISLVLSFPLSQSKLFYIAFILFISSVTSLIDIFIVSKKANLWLVPLILDCFLASILLAMSGGVESSLFMMFFLIIIIYTMRRGQKGSWWSFCVSMIIYGFFLFIQWKGYLYQTGIVNYYSFYYSDEPVTLKVYYYQFFFSLILSLIISAIASWMEERSDKRGKQLEYVRYTTDDILRAMEEGVLTIDNYGDIFFINPSFVFYTGLNMLKKGQACGDAVRKIFEDNHQEVEFIGLDGSKRIFSCDIAELTDINSRITGKMIVLHNLTELRENERRLNEMNQIALMAEMSAGIAHELRNPLTSIRTSVDILFNDLKGEKEEIAKIVKNEVNRINNLIEDFLNFSRLSKPKRENLKIRNLFKDVKKLFKLSHGTKKVALDIILPDGKLKTSLDRNQIIQVLVNLLNNAYQAVEENKSEKNIKVEAHKENINLLITIADNGVGISNENINKIFNPFFSDSHKGTGLGLSIVKKIISLHGGDIRIESEKGRGTNIIISIPDREEREEFLKERAIINKKKSEVKLNKVWNELLKNF